MLDAAGAPPLPRSHGRSLFGLIEDPSTSDWKDVVYSEYCMNDSRAGSGESPNLGGADIHARPGGVQNRMVRSGDWKLNYYHGFDPQLFNLAEDPSELNDRSKDPSCKGVLGEMMDKVLDGWDPDWVQKRMRVLKEEQDLMVQWASKVDPPDTHRWDLRPEMDYVDLESGS